MGWSLRDKGGVKAIFRKNIEAGSEVIYCLRFDFGSLVPPSTYDLAAELILKKFVINLLVK